MANEITKREDKSTMYQVSGEEVKLSESIVRQFLTKGSVAVTQQEAVNFIQLCRYRKLNPFLNEAYLVKFGKDPAQLICGFEAFKRKADENPRYRGYQAGIIVKAGDEIVDLEGAFKMPTDVLVGGWCKVYVDGKEHPVVSRVSLAEYDKGISLWKKIPCTMIRKVAISQALREAFPSDIGAMYTQEELGYVDSDKMQRPKVTTVVEEVKSEITENANKETLDFEDVPEAEEIEVIEAEIINNPGNEDEEPDF